MSGLLVLLDKVSALNIQMTWVAEFEQLFVIACLGLLSQGYLTCWTVLIPVWMMVTRQ